MAAATNSANVAPRAAALPLVDACQRRKRSASAAARRLAESFSAFRFSRARARSCNSAIGGSGSIRARPSAAHCSNRFQSSSVIRHGSKRAGLASRRSRRGSPLARSRAGSPFFCNRMFEVVFLWFANFPNFHFQIAPNFWPRFFNLPATEFSKAHSPPPMRLAVTARPSTAQQPPRGSVFKNPKAGKSPWEKLGP